MENELHKIVFGHSVPANSLLDVSRVTPSSCDVLLLPLIDAVLNETFSVMTAS